MFDSDRDLARRTLTGDRLAFGTIYRRHAPQVFNLLRRLAMDTEAAEDLCQETFLAAYGSLANWRGDSRLSTWLCGIAVTLCRSWRRKQHAPEATLDEIESLAFAGPDPLSSLAIREAQSRIEVAISRLPDACREVFVLVRVEGLSYAEAAACLGVPLGTVHSRLARATGLLRARLDDMEPNPARTAPLHTVPAGGDSHEV